MRGKNVEKTKGVSNWIECTVAAECCEDAGETRPRLSVARSLHGVRI